jgi:hypothetical protein
LAGVGLAVFLVEVLIVIPWFGSDAGGGFRYLSRFSRLGSSPGAALAFAVAHPFRFLALPFEGGRVTYLFGLLSGLLPGVLLALRSMRTLWPLVIAAPLLAVQLYSDLAWQLNSQYGAPVLPSLAVAAGFGLALRVRPILRRALAYATWIGVAVHAVILVGPEAAFRPGGPFDFAFQGSPRAHALARAVALVPRDAAISAQDPITPHLETGTLHVWPFCEEEDEFIALDIGGRAPFFDAETIRAAEERLRGDPDYLVRLDEAGVLLAERRTRATTLCDEGPH